MRSSNDAVNGPDLNKTAKYAGVICAFAIFSLIGIRVLMESN